MLGVESFPTTPAGFRALHDWLAGFGPVVRVGAEGTGAYGVGLAQHLRSNGLVVIEVDRPNRQARRRNGKSDQLDAIEAARAALSGRASGIAKSADGDVEAIRALLVVRRSGRNVRIKYLNQILSSRVHGARRAARTAVVAHRGARVGAASRFLHIAERYSGIERRGDECVAQRVGAADALVDTGSACNAMDNAAGSVTIEPTVV